MGSRAGVRAQRWHRIGCRHLGGQGVEQRVQAASCSFEGGRGRPSAWQPIAPSGTSRWLGAAVVTTARPSPATSTMSSSRPSAPRQGGAPAGREGAAIRLEAIAARAKGETNEALAVLRAGVTVLSRANRLTAFDL